MNNIKKQLPFQVLVLYTSLAIHIDYVVIQTLSIQMYIIFLYCSPTVIQNSKNSECTPLPK